MSIPTDTLDFFRTQWAQRLVDTCTIKSVTGSSFNDTTGQTEPTYTSRYTGACLIRPGPPGAADYGDQLTETRRYTVFIPYDESAVSPGDLVDLTSTRDAHLNETEQLVVRNIRADTYNTVRKLECEENQSD